MEVIIMQTNVEFIFGICPHCGKTFIDVADGSVARTKCGNCKTTFIVSAKNGEMRFQIIKDIKKVSNAN